MAGVPYATAGEFYAAGNHPHPPTCGCGDDGVCEYAEAVAEERREEARS